MTRIFFNLFRFFDKFNFMNFKNVSPKEFLELGLPKTAFRILGEVCWKRPRDKVGICTGGNDWYCRTNVKRDLKNKDLLTSPKLCVSFVLCGSRAHII